VRREWWAGGGTGGEGDSRRGTERLGRSRSDHGEVHGCEPGSIESVWPRRPGGIPKGGENPVSDDWWGAGERLRSTRVGGGGWLMGGWRSGGVEWAQQI